VREEGSSPVLAAPLTSLRESLSNRFLPQFRSREMERQYIENAIASKRLWIRVALFIGTLLFMATHAIVQVQLPADVQAIDFIYRWYVQVPAMFAAFLASLLVINAYLVEKIIAFAITVAILSTTAILWQVGLDGRDFYDIAIMQIQLFGFFLVGVKFRTAILAMVLPLGIHLVVRSILDQQARELGLPQMPFWGPAIVFVAMAIGAYSVDIASRTAYLSQLALNREYADRLSAQGERNQWLKVITDFLRHELKNSLIGVSSSLELLSRRNSNPELDEYLGRAESSTRFMKRLLEEASASTSLEAALERIVFERTNVSLLLQYKREDYQDLYSENRFDFRIEEDVFVSCDADRVIQVLDKLVNNAVEHGDASFPVVVTLAKQGGNVRLTVMDIGDPLVSDDRDLFEPFVSRKEKSAQSGFGFGLYVVKRVVQAHSGTVSAQSLSDPDGAEFVVTLPIEQSIDLLID